MSRTAVIVVLVIVTVIAGCSTIKIGIFRGVMALTGDKVFEAKFIALDNPAFIPSVEAGYLRDEEEVLGVYHNGVAKAYPLTMGFYHHIFNDTIGGANVLVTFCPLTHTAMVFDPLVEETGPLRFTVDGLKESNMIMVDDLTESYWVQLTGEAIEGPKQGSRLNLLPGLHTTWGFWKNLHPHTLVLSRETGFDYDYSVYPWQEKYFKYKKTSRFLFSISKKDDRYHPKEMLLGVEETGTHKAYPFTEIKDRLVLNDVVGNLPIVILYDPDTETITAFSRVLQGETVEFQAETGPNGVSFKDSKYGFAWDFNGRASDPGSEEMCLEPVTAFKAFWFAWFVFYPETEVYTESG
jgi:hypothetical protein